MRYNLTRARLFDISFSAALRYVDHLIEFDGEYPRLQGDVLETYVYNASISRPGTNHAPSLPSPA